MTRGKHGFYEFWIFEVIFFVGDWIFPLCSRLLPTTSLLLCVFIMMLVVAIFILDSQLSMMVESKVIIICSLVLPTSWYLFFFVVLDFLMFSKFSSLKICGAPGVQFRVVNNRVLSKENYSTDNYEEKPRQHSRAVI